jgi:hypothetical protein
MVGHASACQRPLAGAFLHSYPTSSSMAAPGSHFTNFAALPSRKETS